jgi:hypothetical protein
MFAVKKASYFLVLYAFAFILINLTPSFHHRRDFDRAVSAYYKDPTPENAAELRAQRDINKDIDFKFAAVGALIIVTLGYGIYGVARLANRGLKRIRASNSQS